MMTLIDVFSTAAAIITSLGGGTVIVFGLSNWLGKIRARPRRPCTKKKLKLTSLNYKKKLNG